MRIAFPLWNDSVSPVLDTAGILVIVKIENGRILSRHEISLTVSEPRKNAEIIADQADILICGAISRQMASYIASLGVEVYPWTMGNVDCLIEILTNGNIPGPEFIMPGCERNRHRWCSRDGQFKRFRQGCSQNRNKIMQGKRSCKK